MSTEVNVSRGVEEFPNPFKVANLFHWTIVVAAACVGMWLGVEATSATAEATPYVSTIKVMVSVFLLTIAFLHGAWALRYSYFAIAPDKVGKLGVNSSDDKKSDVKAEWDYMSKLILSGMPIADPPKNALVNTLYKYFPNLRHAPLNIQLYAALQWLRFLLASATLISFTVAMLLTWIKPGQGVIALVYFIFIGLYIVSPRAGLKKVLSGKLDSPSMDDFKGIGRTGVITLVVLALAPLASRIFLRFFGENIDAYNIAPILTPIFVLVLLLAAIATGGLCFWALIKQTKGLSGTRARTDEKTLGMFQADVDLPFARVDSWLRSTVGEQSVNKLPTNKIISFNPQINQNAKNGNFSGCRVEESIPRASFGDSHNSYKEAVSAAWQSDQHRPLVLLGVIGVLLFIIMLATILLLTTGLVDSKTGFISTYAIFVFGLFAAAESALYAAHELWQRFEFVSEVVYVKFDGSYTNDNQIFRDQMATDVGIVRVGSEVSSTHTSVRSANIKVCRFTIRSVSFRIEGARYPVEISSEIDGNNEIFEIFERAFHEYTEGRKALLRNEASAKYAYGAAPQQALMIPEDNTVVADDRISPN